MRDESLPSKTHQRGSFRNSALRTSSLRTGSAAAWLLFAIACILILLPLTAVVRTFVVRASMNTTTTITPTTIPTTTTSTANTLKANPTASAPASPAAPRRPPALAPAQRFQLGDAILDARAPAWNLIITSLGYAALISFVAVLFGVLAAISLRGAWRTYGPMVLVPLALPNYLAYWAFGQLRAPGTWIGNAIEQSITSGATWVPLAVGKLVAVLGLAIWAWPIVACATGASLARIPQGVQDALSLDASPVRKLFVELRLASSGIFAGAACVVLLMLGSAVPLHLAQVPTISLAAWQVLSLSPGSPAAWIALWPILLPAAIASVLLARKAILWASHFATNTDWETPEIGSRARFGLPQSHRGLRRWKWPAIILLLISVPLPMIAMAVTIRDASVFSRFGWEMGDAAVASLRVAIWVGIGFAILMFIACRCFATNLASSRQRLSRIVTLLSIALLCMGLLTPGLLIGSAWSHLWSIPPRVPILGWFNLIRDTDVPMILAHLSRFGILAVLAGCFAAYADAPTLRDVRAIDGVEAGTTRAWKWVRAGGLLGSPILGVVGLFAVAAIGMVLSMHEIETTIMVQPPGTLTVAQVILGYLHFSRLQEMSVAGLYLVGGAILVAGFASWTLAVIWCHDQARSVRTKLDG